MGTRYNYVTEDGGPPNEGIPPGMEQPQETPLFIPPFFPPTPPPRFLFVPGPPPPGPVICFGPPPSGPVMVSGPPCPAQRYFPVPEDGPPYPKGYPPWNGATYRTVEECQRGAELESLRRANKATRGAAAPANVQPSASRMQAEIDSLRRENEVLRAATAAPETSHRPSPVVCPVGQTVVRPQTRLRDTDSIIVNVPPRRSTAPRSSSHHRIRPNT